MIEDFSINRDENRAVYRQIMSGITSLVDQGKLIPGDRLPSERDLAEQLGTSRGTVKKAYQELKINGVVTIIMGSGAYISETQNMVDAQHSRQSMDDIERVVRALLSSGISIEEVQSHFNIILHKIQGKGDLVHIAMVDCSKEALHALKVQLDYIPRIQVDRILLDDIEQTAAALSTLQDYDIILTPARHYDDLCMTVPTLRSRIIQTVLSPNRQTVINLASIPKDKRVGIVCDSPRFRDVILRYMTRDVAVDNMLVMQLDTRDVAGFAQNKDYLILPGQGVIAEDIMHQLSPFHERGGISIHFDYQIHRDSVIDIEQKISIINKQRLGEQ